MHVCGLSEEAGVLTYVSMYRSSLFSIFTNKTYLDFSVNQTKQAIGIAKDVDTDRYNYTIC